MTWRTVTVTGYGLLLVVMIALVLVSHLPGTTVPTFGTVMSRVMSTRSGRIAVLVGWLWIGMHYFAL